MTAQDVVGRWGLLSKLFLGTPQPRVLLSCFLARRPPMAPAGHWQSAYFRFAAEMYVKSIIIAPVIITSPLSTRVCTRMYRTCAHVYYVRAGTPLAIRQFACVWLLSAPAIPLGALGRWPRDRMFR